MRCVEVSRPGGPEVLSLIDVPMIVRRPGDVLIEVQAAGVNRPDLMQRAGKYPPPRDASPVLGLEVAGVVAEADEDSGLSVGAAVCALAPGGGYAEYCAVPAEHCLPIPEGVSMAEAAGIPETYFTVWANVFQMGRLQRGEWLLVHGGASGIGTTAIQLARARQAHVIVTAGSDAKLEACRTLGAALAINYRTSDFAAEVLRVTSGRGVDVVLDMVGGEYTPRNIECLAPLGRLVQIAAQNGAEVTINLLKIMHKRLILTGSTMRPRSRDEKAAIAAELREHVWPLLNSRDVRVVVDRVYPLDEVRQAHEYLQRGENIGKVILQVR